ncbi:hypothetical protein EVAR_82115_1 [Eumeta japonica]|uniref:Uncharacterized protein n=1 Tax=Eumeta variegata TaxID=151549 RepID=A0A4C1U1Q5_EUMVA|nr:hypothetical protein EVAR_82115_1 [Eumeta japonica]
MVIFILASFHFVRQVSIALFQKFALPQSLFRLRDNQFRLFRAQPPLRSSVWMSTDYCAKAGGQESVKNISVCISIAGNVSAHFPLPDILFLLKGMGGGDHPLSGDWNARSPHKNDIAKNGNGLRASPSNKSSPLNFRNLDLNSQRWSELEGLTCCSETRGEN